MDKRETMQILAVLKVAYPAQFEKQDYEEKKEMVALWQMMLGDHPYEAVDGAVRAHISCNKYPPTVADINEKLQQMGEGREEMGELEAWMLVSRALRNSAYRSREEWERLPEEIRRIVSPELLRNWAMVSEEEAETVLQSQFLKSYRTAVKKQRQFTMLPASVQRYALSRKGEKDLP